MCLSEWMTEHGLIKIQQTENYREPWSPTSWRVTELKRESRNYVWGLLLNPPLLLNSFESLCRYIPVFNALNIYASVTFILGQSGNIKLDIRLYTKFNASLFFCEERGNVSWLALCSFKNIYSVVVFQIMIDFLARG